MTVTANFCNNSIIVPFAIFSQGCGHFVEKENYIVFTVDLDFIYVLVFLKKTITSFGIKIFYFYFTGYIRV